MDVTVQHCPRCDQSLPLPAFPERYQGKPGNYCAACMQQYMRAYWAARRKPFVLCLIDGCSTRAPQATGRCAAHRIRSARHESFAYEDVHRRLRASRGRASDLDCVDCGGRAGHWTYSHADPYELQEIRRSGAVVRFSAYPEYYEPRCVICHNRFDRVQTRDFKAA